ncbi:MAG: sigma-70 family RNA polymerase sigma factor, partial [Clostridiaceae bacterium]|nr:sigma-70 family RNA polymerase sigma factor [Clostridiaceae bacterium]
MTLSKEDTEEILQEAYIRAYKSLYRCTCTSRYTVWLYKIVVNEFRNYYKRKGKKQKPESSTLYDLSSTESNYQSQEDYNLTVKLINSLEENQRMAFLLEPLEGFNYKEISLIIGESVESAKMKVNKAKAVVGQKFCELKKGEK